MVLVLKRDAGKKEIEDLNNKLYKDRRVQGFNAKKFNGILKIKGDPLEIQKKMRDEWERYEDANNEGNLISCLTAYLTH